MTLHLKSDRERLALQAGQYEGWFERLKSLHTFPDDAWRIFNDLGEKTRIQLALETVGPKSFSDGSFAETQAEERLNEAFRLGTLLWPTGRESDRVINLKTENPEKALSVLLDALHERRFRSNNLESDIGHTQGSVVAEIADEVLNHPTLKDLRTDKEALKTSFATEAAHTYWAKTKYERHSTLAVGVRRLGFAYLAALLLIAAGLFFFGRGFNQPIWQTPLSEALPFAIIVVAAIWLGRLLSKTYMAHVQLAEDAKERATMIETYIALIRADVIDKSKADEAQKALFRPAASGLLAGDSGPDTPIEIITKAISGSRS